MKGRQPSTVFLTVLLLPFFACQGETDEAEHQEETAISEMGEQHESMHGEEGGDHESGTILEEGRGHESEEMMEEGGHHTEGHMQHMSEVKEWLKEELGDAYDEPVPTVSQEKIEVGKQVYTRNCASCHGEEGKGNGPAAAGLSTKPSDFTDPEHATYYSDRGRLYIIRNGVPETAMAPWKNTLNEDEIMAVFGYIRSLADSGRSGESRESGEHRH